MNNKMKYFFIIVSILFAIILFSNNGLAREEKLVFVSVDNIDLTEYEDKNCGTGLLSLKPVNKNMESIYFGISYRRTFLSDISIKNEIDFKGIEPELENYAEVKTILKEEYPNTDKDKGIESIGQILKRNNIKRAYYGNDKDYIILSDNLGRYDKGGEIVPDFRNLEDFLDKEFREIDIVFLSIDLDEDKYLEELLKSKYPVLIWSKYKRQNGIIKNKSLSSAIYKNEDNKKGILISDSTKRLGLINSLDLGTSVLEYFNLDDRNDSGKNIEIEEKIGDKYLNKKFNSYMNLTISKYIFHGLIIAISFILIISYFVRRDIYIKNREKIYIPILFILFSIIFSFFSEKVFLYNGLIILSSIALYIFIEKKRYNILLFVLILDFIMLIGIFFFKDILYNSFIGYNSILAGGRYYGLNNDIMGCFVATGVLSSVILAKRGYKYLGILYMIIHVLGLTGKYGSNFGGLLTIAFATLIYTYYFLFEIRNRKKMFFALSAVLLIAFGIAFLGKGETNHIINFFKRVYIYGFIEFKDMIVKKIVHLFRMGIVPPWSIIFITESIYIIKRIRNKFKKDNLIKTCYLVSLGALFFNDTGIVAFTYINLFTIAIISYLEERGYELEQNYED